MELWIATVGLYEDQTFVGVGRTEAEAYGLIAKVRAAGEYVHYSVEDDSVCGPVVLGEAYGWQLNKI